MAIRVGDPCSVISQLPTDGIGRVDELHIFESFRNPHQSSESPSARPPDDRLLQRPILHHASTQRAVASPLGVFSPIVRRARPQSLGRCTARTRAARTSAVRCTSRFVMATNRVLSLPSDGNGDDRISDFSLFVTARVGQILGFLSFLQRRDCTP